MKVSQEELQTLFELENALLASGLFSPEEVAEVLQTMLKDVDTKSVGKAIAVALDHKRMKAGLFFHGCLFGRVK